MTAFDFYSKLREDILEQISGVKDSNSYYDWDNTTPNYVTKRRLEELLNKHILLAKELGVYVVTRYSSCTNSQHEGYPTENRYGLSIEYKDPKYIWGGEQLYQGERSSICPCSPKNMTNNNWVIDDFVYDPNFNQRDCKAIALILEDISEAIQQSYDKKTRSGIREHLLKALLRVNDAILPQPVDEYISLLRHKNNI